VKALSSFSLSSLRQRRVVVGALVAALAGVSWYWFMHREYVADVRTICTAESQTETTLLASRLLVESTAAAKITSGKGEELFKTLRAAPPDSAARQLRRAADAVGVSDCPSVGGYEKLATRASISEHADRMCRRLDPIILAKVPRAKRPSYLAEWAHDHIREDDLDAFLAPIAAMPLEQAAPRLKDALSEINVHFCGVLVGLESAVSPQPGPNVLIQAVGIQGDAREAAMKEAFQKRLDDLLDCYKKGLEKDRNASGTLSMKFRLTDKGVIDFALAQTDSTLFAPATATCVTDLIKATRGPEGKSTSPGGIIVEFWTAP
jgi:hypothetical protein